MAESVTLFIYIILGIIGVVAALVIGAYSIMVAVGLVIYLMPLLATIGGLIMFTEGGGIGTAGLFLFIPGVLCLYGKYFRCRKCGLGFKIFWIVRVGREEFGYKRDLYGTKCINCGDADHM